MMLGLLDVMPFGVYKGDLIGTVIETDPSYVYWAINHTQLCIDEQAEDYLKENL